MCLAVPGRIVRLVDNVAPEGRFAEVDFVGIRKSVNLVFLPEAVVGDYVVVHAGFATTVIPEAEALEAQAHFREIERLNESSEATPPPRQPTPPEY
jgi:hydrogenase expression/formation protein HypC